MTSADEPKLPELLPANIYYSGSIEGFDKQKERPAECLNCFHKSQAQSFYHNRPYSGSDNLNTLYCPNCKSKLIAYIDPPHPDAARPAGEADWSKTCLNCMAMGHTWDNCPDPLSGELRQMVEAPTPPTGTPEDLEELERRIRQALTPATIETTYKAGEPRPIITFTQVSLPYVMPDVMRVVSDALKAQAAAYDARFEAALGPDNYEAEVDSAEADYVDADEAHISNSLKATARARWYASSGGNDGK